MEVCYSSYRKLTKDKDDPRDTDRSVAQKPVLPAADGGCAGYVPASPLPEQAGKGWAPGATAEAGPVQPALSGNL